MNGALIFLIILMCIKSSWQQENGLLLATYNDRINRIDPLTGRVDVLFYIENLNRFDSIKVDFDTKHNCLFYNSNNKIFKKYLEGNQTAQVIADDVYVVNTISYDWISELTKLKSLDKFSRLLQSVKIVHDEHQAVVINHMRRTIKEINAADITIDHVNKYVFWISSRHNSIWRSNLDGSEAKIIVNNSSLRRSIAITFDHSTNHIYWSDTLDNTIGHCDVNGDSMVIRKLQFWPFHEKIYARFIAVTGSRMFLDDYRSGLLFVVDKDKNIGDLFCRRPRLTSLKFVPTSEKLSANYKAAENCNCTVICEYKPRHDQSFACLFEGDLNQTMSGRCVCNNSKRPNMPRTDGYCTRNVNMRQVPSGTLYLATLLPILLALNS